MELNEVYKKRRDKLDFSDIQYWRGIVSLNDEDSNYLETLPEPIKEDVLSSEERARWDNLWKDVEFICGGIMNPDFYIMYARYYLGHSFREVAKTFGKRTYANTIVAREKKIINKLRFLYSKPCDKVPYRTSKSNKL